ncbi:aldehyde dehydrogenase family protein [bacterium]|nr:aldehyde dehydrogenase family protein [bacterium]
MTTIDWASRAKDLNLQVRNFIDGHYIDQDSNTDLMNKFSPRDGCLLYSVAEGSSGEIDCAVANAKAAFDDGRWRLMPLHQRQAILHKLMELIDAHKEELALYESLDVGKPIAYALNGDVPNAINYIKNSVNLADKLHGPSSADVGNFSFQLRKPIGVVGAIIGWNFPLSLATVKVGAALIMGNSLVLKPSEFTSLSAGRLAELAIEAGVPPGVFNVVHGAGITVGAALAHHRDVNMLSFTGSSATGKQMMISAGQSNMKRLVLECGGKSPYLVFDDYGDDVDLLVADIVGEAFSNQGAVCTSSTRLLIQESMVDKLLPKIIAETEKLNPQDPLDSDTGFGAIINEDHLNKVLTYIESGKHEGATLITGGERIDVCTSDGSTQGYYLKPAIFTDVNPQQKIAQEEIFGPVLSVFTFKDEAEAIELANNSCYGLKASAATTDQGRALRLAQSLNAGEIIILSTSTPSDGGLADFGLEPHRESGLGVENGIAGLIAYTVSSAVHMVT